MGSDGKSVTSLEDQKIGIRTKLAALWTGHFLLWTFGDMVSLLQEETEPVSDDLLLFVAAPLAIIQASMILFSLIGRPVAIRLASIGLGAVYTVFNLGYISEAQAGWEYLLGIGYVVVSALIIWHAWKWPEEKDIPKTQVP
ncbi:MAG: hypothetical protein JSV94_05385 [Methanobacteriota archaeon]|nr:MAG: hypothetical protein JSV94_05385 [Euryarchaeota archaeon]